MDPSTIASWVQLGFAVAVATYLLTKSMPRLEERAEKRDAAFLAALDKQHVEHKSEIKEAYAHNEKQTDRVIEAVNALECSPTNRNGK